MYDMFAYMNCYFFVVSMTVNIAVPWILWDVINDDYILYTLP